MKPATPQPLSQFIQVGARFLRSVNLEKDYLGGQRNGDYIVTPTARQVLSRVAEGLRDQSPYRAWTITGPYGVGKSAFAVYLTRLFCPIGDSTVAARQQLRRVDPVLAQHLLGGKTLAGSRKGFFPILITGRRTATSLCLLQGIYAAVSAAKDRPFQPFAKHLLHLLRRAQRETFLDSATVVAALTDVNSTAVQAGYSGVLVLIDELGKLFEFAARSPHKADVFVLQQLAEFASRSAGQPLVLIGLLHQSFEDYGQHLDMVSRKEWAKIQGRYEDVAFLEPADQVIRMIASAIRWTNQSTNETLRKRVAATARLAAECGIIPSGMGRDEFEAAAVAAYPLHPTTLVAFDGLQNKLIVSIFPGHVHAPAINTIEFQNAAEDFFQISDLLPAGSKQLEWPTFENGVSEKNDKQLAALWIANLKELIRSALSEKFVENNLLIPCPSQNKTYRAVVARIVSFYSGRKDIHIYLFELYKRVDYGDIYTSMFAKAVEIGCRYRSLFLEPNSRFAPTWMDMQSEDKYQKCALQLIKEMDLIHQDSMESHLDSPGFLAKIYGVQPKGINLGKLADQFRNAEASLRDAAAGVFLADKQNFAARKAKFRIELLKFCLFAYEINADYVAKAIEKLDERNKEIRAEMQGIVEGWNSQLKEHGADVSGGAKVEENRRFEIPVAAV